MALKLYQSIYNHFTNSFLFSRNLHLQTAHYSTEETNHAKILDNIDRLHC